MTTTTANTTAAHEYLRQARSYDAWWRFGFYQNEASALYDQAGYAFFRAGDYANAYKAYKEYAQYLPHDISAQGFVFECLVNLDTHTEEQVREAAIIFYRMMLGVVSDASCNRVKLYLEANRDLATALLARVKKDHPGATFGACETYCRTSDERSAEARRQLTLRRSQDMMRCATHTS